MSLPHEDLQNELFRSEEQQTFFRLGDISEII